ncbi:hypothetical protein EGI11_06825 [Chryseobacterium sp. H3056]|uniref:Uncharacterized protein n=1 Tax=Kaistella daneshvariae TaxID=2487074 RepID=A0A3N0WVL3_9FLAO|nr:hypothetical protein EGI11_06825 [Kaistella daneshvariae]
MQKINCKLKTGKLAQKQAKKNRHNSNLVKVQNLDKVFSTFPLQLCKLLRLRNSARARFFQL